MDVHKYDIEMVTELYRLFDLLICVLAILWRVSNSGGEQAII